MIIQAIVEVFFLLLLGYVLFDLIITDYKYFKEQKRLKKELENNNFDVNV